MHHELEDRADGDVDRFAEQWQEDCIWGDEGNFTSCGMDSVLWKMSEAPLDPITDNLKKSLYLQIAAHHATREGMAYLSRSLSIKPSQQPEAVTMNRGQFEAILGRLRALEAKVGVVPQNPMALSGTNQKEIATVTRDLFGSNPEIEQITDSNDDNTVHRVTITVSNAEPENVSANRSKWHDMISELDIPKELRDNLRLKVIYQ